MPINFMPQWFLFSFLLKRKKVILVDYFDTLCFRRIHSHQMYDRWAECLLKKVPSLAEITNKQNLIMVRKKVSSSLQSQYEEPPYSEIIKKMVEQLGWGGRISDLCTISLKIETSVEMGTHYPNGWIVKMLKKMRGYGLKVYLVSDFHLPQIVYNSFLKHLLDEKILDGVFVSEAYNLTKRKGGLYNFVLKSIGFDANDVIMIGDNWNSDVVKAEMAGIRGLWYFPLLHKLLTNYRKLTKYDYLCHAVKAQIRWLRKNTLYEEYTFPLLYFCQELYNESKQRKINKLAFLSRGGYLMQKLFDKFQEITIPICEEVETKYCMNSRRVNIEAEKNANQKKMLQSYMNHFVDNETLYLVDEGWNCSSQIKITELLGINTVGFYIGTFRKPKIENSNICSRNGILFDIDERGAKSKCYGILRSNCSLYEQLLTSPEGSLVSYKRGQNGSIEFETCENDMEHYLYQQYIGNLQERIVLDFEALIVWCSDIVLNKKSVAREILKTLLFASDMKCRFLNDLDRNRFSNFGNPIGSKENAIKDKGFRDVRINPIRLILHPEEYVHVFCKLQRKLVNYRFIKVMYYPFAFCFYWYVRICEKI